MEVGLHGLHGVFVPSLVIVVKNKDIAHALIHHLMELEECVWATVTLYQYAMLIHAQV